MAKLIAPLLSFGAQGQIGKTMVMANWRGIDYARQYVIPANPQTTAQQANRTRFAFLREAWKRLPADALAPWNAFAQGRKFLGVNKFVGENNRLLNGPPAATDIQDLIFSPGAAGGVPPVSIAATTGAGSGEIDVVLTESSQLPDGWTITEAVFMAIPDQDPVGIFAGIVGSITDAATPFDTTLTGLTPATSYVVGGWLVYEKANGKAAYSVSLNDVATSGA